MAIFKVISKKRYRELLIAEKRALDLEAQNNVLRTQRDTIWEKLCEDKYRKTHRL